MAGNRLNTQTRHTNLVSPVVDRYTIGVVAVTNALSVEISHQCSGDTATRASTDRAGLLCTGAFGSTRLDRPVHPSYRLGRAVVFIHWTCYRVNHLFSALCSTAHSVCVRGHRSSPDGGCRNPSRQTTGCIFCRRTTAGQARHIDSNGPQFRAYGGRVRSRADDWRKHTRQNPSCVYSDLRPRRSNGILTGSLARSGDGPVLVHSANRPIAPEKAQ